MKKFNKSLLIALATTGLLFGCGSDVLDVSNENNPDTNKVNFGQSGDDVENIASGMFNTIFNGEHAFAGVHMMLDVAADHSTCSYGNAGMRDMSWEPRNFAWNNTPAYANQSQTKFSYEKWYSAIGTAAGSLKGANGGTLEFSNGTARIKAFSKYALGLAYGNLALVFDKAHIIDDTKTVDGTLGSASPYGEVAAAAVAYLEEAIALTDGTFSIPAAWMGTPTDLSGAEFKKILNTTAARILSYMPRNKTELTAVDWAKVKAFADAGITSDFTVVMDGYTKWYFEAADYLTYPGWGRTDMRVANMMEPSLPDYWEDIASFPTPAEPTNPLDARLETDFGYLPSNDFPAARGYYHFSCYRYGKYDDIMATGVGPLAEVAVAENDMLRAEARAYSGDLAGAATIINEGTRVTRGNLAPVAANLTDIVQAIHHERNVELYLAGVGFHFFEMRKLDLLQKGTPLHLPIPAQVLQLFGVTEFYTFGYVNKADGIGTALGGWHEHP